MYLYCISNRKTLMIAGLGIMAVTTTCLLICLVLVVSVLIYREPLKGSSEVVRICGGKIACFCLPQVNKTQLSHLISHNLGRAF